MAPTEPGSATPTYTVADNRGVRLVLDPIDDVVVGGVLFRVGTVDESLSTYGITHLIEHLALSELNLSSVHSNGAVTDTYTAFYAQGSPEAVVGFLNAVCRTLRNLPTARWRTEAKVLDAESAGRPTNWGASMGVWRYGAAGRGLRSQETEWGLLRLSDQEIADWSRRYFTAGNAVAYLSTATAPADLDLTLPHGNAVALPVQQQLSVAMPAAVPGPKGVVAFEGHVDRSPAGIAFAMLVEQAAFRDVRVGSGLTYTVTSNYSPLDTDNAAISLVAEIPPGGDAALTAGIVGTAKRLRDGHLSQTEVDDAIAATTKKRGSIRLPGARPGGLQYAAARLLIDGSLPDHDAVDRGIAAVTRDDMVAMARRWWDSGLIATPTPEAAQLVGVPSAALAILPPVGHGRGIADFDQPGVQRSALQISPDALTYGAKRTLPFNDVVGLLGWSDGGRVLIGRDGRQIRIEPGLFAGLSKAKVEQLIDAKIDPRLHIPLPERTKDAVPKRWNSRLVLRLATLLLAGFSVLGLFTVLLAGFQAGWEVGLVLAVIALPFWVATAWVATTAKRKNAFDTRPDVF